MPFLLHGVLKSCMLLWAALLYIAMSWHATRPPFPNNTVLARLHLITDRHEGGTQPPGVFALSHRTFALRSPLTDRWEDGAQPPGVFALSHRTFALRSPLTDRWEGGTQPRSGCVPPSHLSRERRRREHTNRKIVLITL